MPKVWNSNSGNESKEETCVMNIMNGKSKELVEAMEGLTCLVREKG